MFYSQYISNDSITFSLIASLTPRYTGTVRALAAVGSYRAHSTNAAIFQRDFRGAYLRQLVSDRLRHNLC